MPRGRAGPCSGLGARGRGEASGPPTDTEPRPLSPLPFSSMMCQLSVVESKSATFPSEKARHLLDDSVLESRSPRRGLALASSSAVTNGLSLGKRLRPPPHRAPQPGAAARRVLMSVRRCAASVSPAAAAGASQRGPGSALILPAALSTAGRAKEQPDTHSRDPPSWGGSCQGLRGTPAPGGATGPSGQDRAGEAARGQQLGGPPGPHVCPCRHTEESESGRTKKGPRG